MSKFLTLGLALICTLVHSPAFSQRELEEDEIFEIADLYQERAASFTCNYVKTEINGIKKKKASDLRRELQDQKAALLRAADEAAEAEVRQELLAISKSLESASLNPEGRSIGVKGLEAICKSVRTPTKLIKQGVGIANTVVFNTLTLPFTTVMSFFKGLFSKGKNEPGKREDFLYRAFGPKHNISSYVLGVLVTNFPHVFLGINPVFAGMNLSLSVELITNYECFRARQFDSETSAYCKLYEGLKNFYHSGKKKSFRLGKKLQDVLSKRIFHKRTARGPEKFCALSRKKQIKFAGAAIERMALIDPDERVLNADVLLPIHKNQCTKIIVNVESVHIEELKKKKPLREGIELVYLPPGEYPADHYFSDEELQGMTFTERLCHDVERQTFGQVSVNKFALYGDFFKSTLAPSLLGSPESRQLTLPTKSLYQGDLRHLRSIIFALGATEEERIQAEALKLEGRALVKDLKKLFDAILKTRTYEKCLSYIDQNSPDLDEFRQRLERLTAINSDPLLRKVIEADATQAQFKNVRKKLKLPWELVPTNNLGDILDALNSSDVANVVVLSHGKNSGHLVDMNNQEFPRESFGSISPSLLSLNFYSCHSQKLIGLYGLNNKLLEGPSFYKIRHLTSVRENDFMDGNQFAPVSAFGYYLRELDATLTRATKGATRVQEVFGSELPEYQGKELCEADLSGITIEKGSYAVTLNDQLIDLISDNNDHANVKFPCEFIRSGENTVRLKNVISTGGSKIQNLSSLELEIGGTVLTRENATLRLNSMTIFKFFRE